MLSKIIWLVATSLIIISGIYFTFKLNFVQFKFIRMFKSLFIKNKNKDTIKPFESLMMVLAGRIGVGSIAGIAISIYYGGIGSIFWMWISSILGASLTFIETALGMMYQKKDIKSICKGGPSYYIKYGLNNKLLGNIYALIIIISDIVGFISIQTNTITHSIQEIVNIDSKIIGTLLCILVIIIIIGGAKRIAKFSSKMVPTMTLLYLFICLIIIVINAEKIPNIFITIIKSAFEFKAIGGGVLGSIVIGIQRGIFSSEAGIGTGAIAAATVETLTQEEKLAQGYTQMLGVYITTFLICTSTALILLTTNVSNLNFNNFNGIELVQLAFTKHLGGIGNYFVFLIIFLFAFTTILSSYYNGESSLKYFIEKPKKSLKLLKLFTCLSIMFGAISSSSIIWNFIDAFVGILAIINIYAIIKLQDKVIKSLNEK
ncbi:MAG: alanine:cation symporter family protein [Firmicutes bacterium]|nr:alanine:cation symporter family protein [Bacillota bacterium]